MVILIGRNGELTLFLSQGKGSRVRHSLVCFGPKRHYRKDGMCRHLELFLQWMRPWHRSRTTVALFGDSGPAGPEGGRHGG